jgi:hypothetical protein
MVGYRGLRAQMPKLHLEDETPAKKKSTNKYLKILLGLGVLFSVPVIGTTLAATIAINGGGSNTVNFGQGVIVAAACDSTITVTPYSTYVEADNAFKLSSVKISGLDPVGCASKVLRIRFYPTTGSADSALTVASGSATTDAIIVTMQATPSNSTAPTKESSANYSVSNLTSATDPTEFTVTLVTQPAASSVDRVTIESY